MKKGIHPKYADIEVKCACGNVIKTRSTRKDFEVNICSACHPFYTGAEDRFVDTAGRVERFQKRFEWSGEKAKKEAGKPRSKATKGAKPLTRVESRARGAAAAKPAGGEKAAGEAPAAEGKSAPSADGAAEKSAGKE